MAHVNPQELETYLKRGLSPLYVVYGEEPLQRQECADAVRLQARNGGYGERTVYTVTGAGFDWSQILGAMSALSLFASRQLMEIRIPSSKPGREGGVVLQQLIAQLARSDDQMLLLILEERLDRSAKNTAWFKALESSAVMVECRPIERQALPQWLTRRLAALGLRIDASDEGRRCLSFLANHTEGNLLAANQEMQKLALLYPADGEYPHTLQFDEVQSAVLDVARYDLFQLPQVILSGQVERSLHIFDGLIEEGHPLVRLHWVLADEITTLWRVRSRVEEKCPLPMALRENRVWGLREKTYEKIVPQLTIGQCTRLLKHAQICDGLVKGLQTAGWPIDPAQALRRLLLEMVDAARGQKGSPSMAHLALHA